MMIGLAARMSVLKMITAEDLIIEVVEINGDGIYIKMDLIE